MALLAVKRGADEDHQEKCLSQLYDHMPEGLTPLATLKNDQQRQQLGESRPSPEPVPCCCLARLVSRGGLGGAGVPQHHAGGAVSEVSRLLSVEAEL